MLNNILLLLNNFKGTVGRRARQSMCTQVSLRDQHFDQDSLVLKHPQRLQRLAIQGRQGLSHEPFECDTFSHAPSFNMEIAPAWKATQYRDIRGNCFYGTMQSFNSCTYFPWGNLGRHTTNWFMWVLFQLCNKHKKHHWKMELSSSFFWTTFLHHMKESTDLPLLCCLSNGCLFKKNVFFHSLFLTQKLQYSY